MTKKVDFYFDFISPYSYLAHQKIKAIKNVSFNFLMCKVRIGTYKIKIEIYLSSHIN